MNKLPPVRYVRQIDPCGCAIAAIASTIGNTYYDVKERANKLLKNNRMYNECNPTLCTPHMFKIIRSFGYSVNKTNNLNRKKRSILTLRLSGRWHGCGDDLYHCIVWDPAFGGRFIDPASDIPEDRNYYRRQWYRADKETLIISECA